MKTRANIVSGERVILRDRQPSDVESYLRWQTSGEWRLYDAPWEGVRTSMTAEDEGAFRTRFLEQCQYELPVPRKRATIAAQEGEPLGWVNRYGDERFPEAYLVGIDVCEDAYMNQGIGTEALGLWIGYLFSNSDIHRIGLDTWSFNERMIHVAEKLGFVREGAERELIQWQGKWLDLVHFGMLRKEWEARYALALRKPLG
ncbi:MAG: GNAT family N-acetyltransferase [Anaerolineae bacterium]|nr:GNAT family N-acetyltransferase [Anaerolineae bacterium]